MHHWSACLTEGSGGGEGETLLPVLLMRSSEMNFSHPGTSNITCVGRAVSSVLQQVSPSYSMHFCMNIPQ